MGWKMVKILHCMMLIVTFHFKFLMAMKNRILNEFLIDIFIIVRDQMSDKTIWKKKAQDFCCRFQFPRAIMDGHVNSQAPDLPRQKCRARQNGRLEVTFFIRRLGVKRELIIQESFNLYSAVIVNRSFRKFFYLFY